MLTLKDHVAGNTGFQYYRAGNLMYKTSTGIEFPIPISDTNEATFPRTEKGIFFMRWIRKHLEAIDVMGAPKASEPIDVSQFLTKSGFDKYKFTP